MGRCPERQRGRTVNPLAEAFAGSSPARPTVINLITADALVAQLVEHTLGKGEVMGSNPIQGFGFLVKGDRVNGEKRQPHAGKDEK